MPDEKEYLANCRVTVEDLYRGHKWQFELIDHDPRVFTRDLHRFVRGYLHRDARPEKEPQLIWPPPRSQSIDVTVNCRKQHSGANVNPRKRKAG